MEVSTVMNTLNNEAYKIINSSYIFFLFMRKSQEIEILISSSK